MPNAGFTRAPFSCPVAPLTAVIMLAPAEVLIVGLGYVPDRSPPAAVPVPNFALNVFQSVLVKSPVTEVVDVGIVWLLAAVILPCWSTVNWPTEVVVP